MIELKNVLDLIAKGSIYSLIIFFIDFIIFFIFTGGSTHIGSTLSLVVLLEGGLCLVAGSAAVLYSPSIAKINEVLFGSKPWSAIRQKQIEKQVQILIGTGSFLVIEGLIISII
jgi:hypothetical protein